MTHWVQAEEKEGGRRKQGRERKLQKAVGRKDPLSPSVGEEVGKW